MKKVNTIIGSNIDPKAPDTVFPGLTLGSNFGPPNNSGYEILYIVQEDIIGPTGANFDMTTAVTGGPTSLNAGYVPGVTSTPYGLGASAIGLYSSAFLGYFNGFNRDASELPDYPCAPIGAPFLLTNCTFDFPWDEAEVNWNQLDVTATPGITGNDSVSNFSYFNYMRNTQTMKCFRKYCLV